MLVLVGKAMEAQDAFTSKSKFWEVVARLEELRGHSNCRHHLSLPDRVFVGGQLDHLILCAAQYMIISIHSTPGASTVGYRPRLSLQRLTSQHKCAGTMGHNAVSIQLIQLF